MGYSCVKFIIELTLTDLSEAAKPVREPADEPVQGGETYLVEVVSGSGMIGSLRAGYSHSEPVPWCIHQFKMIALNVLRLHTQRKSVIGSISCQSHIYRGLT
jgi:hypothetical protein